MNIMNSILDTHTESDSGIVKKKKNYDFGKHLQTGRVVGVGELFSFSTAG